MRSKSDIYAGFGKVDITPPHPQGMTLFGMPRPWPGARGVNDRLMARAMYVACGDEKFLLLVCDIVMSEVIHPRHLEALDALAEYGQIPRPNVWFVCTHTHSSFGGRGRHANPYLRKVQHRHVKNVVQKLERLGRRTIDSAQPAKIGHGQGAVENVGSSRRVKLSDGLVVTGWGDGPSPPPGKRIVGRGPHDPNVGVIMVRDLDDQPLGAMVNYNSHVHAYPALEFSAELAGATCRRLEQRMPGLTALFNIGSQGDVALSENLEAQSSDPDQWTKQFRRMMKRMSTTLVDRIEQVCEGMSFETRGRMHSGNVNLKIKNSSTGEADEPLHCLAINDVALMGEGEELFAEYGLQVKARSPFRSTFVIGLKGGHNFYFPTDLGLEEGGYESKLWIEPGSFDRVIDSSVRLLERMHQELRA